MRTLIERVKCRKAEIAMSMECVRDEMRELWDHVRTYPGASISSYKEGERALCQIDIPIRGGTDTLAISKYLGAEILRVQELASGRGYSVASMRDTNRVLDDLANILAEVT